MTPTTQFLVSAHSSEPILAHKPVCFSKPINQPLNCKQQLIDNTFAKNLTSWLFIWPVKTIAIELRFINLDCRF
jgi:hypothetical protein